MKTASEEASAIEATDENRVSTMLETVEKQLPQEHISKIPKE